MRIVSKSIVLVMVLLICASFAVMASGEKEQEGAEAEAEKEVVFWEFDTRDAYVQAWENAISNFEEQNPNIDVKMEIVPWADQQQRITSAMATGGLPDVSFLGNNVVAQYQAAGELAPLDPYFEDYSETVGEDVTEDFWPGDVGYYKLDGKFWGAPLAVETRALYYRKDLFRQAGLDPENPPQSWSEMVDAAVKLTNGTQDGVYGWAAPMSIDYLTIHNFAPIYLSHGARLLNDEGRCGLDTPEFRDALQKYVSVYDQGATHPDAPTMPGNEFRRGFQDGKYAMIVDHPGIWKDLNNEDAPFLDEVGVTKVPQGPEGRFAFLGGWPLVLWKESDVKEAAAQWILHATRPDGALKQLSIQSGMIPASQSLAQQEPWSEWPLSVFVDQLSKARPYQHPKEPIPQMGQIEVDSFQTAIQALALGEKSVDQAVNDLCADINKTLEQ